MAYFWRASGEYFGLVTPAKKARELCSVVAFGKTDKEEILAVISPLLWEGKVDKVGPYLEDIKPRNVKKHEEIIEYLLKHKAEIIDYKKRKEAKKTNWLW